MFNILPHKFQAIAAKILLLFTLGPFIISEIYQDFYFPKRIEHLAWAVAIILYFLAKDKISDEYLDSLKLKSVSIVFIASGVIGFLFSDHQVPLQLVALNQVLAYALILFLLKKFS